MQRAVRLSMVGALALLLVEAAVSSAGCAPDAVLGGPLGGGGSGGATSASSSASSTSSTGSASSTSSSSSSGSSSSGGCTEGASCSTGLPGKCAAGMEHCSPSSSCVGPAPTFESCSMTSDLNCDGIPGCTGRVRWAAAFAPTMGTPNDHANGANGVTFSAAGDVFATGQLGDTTKIGGVTLSPPETGFLASLDGASGAVKYVKSFGDTGIANSGACLAHDAAHDAVLVGGFFQGNDSLSLQSGAFVAALDPTTAMVQGQYAPPGMVAAVVRGQGPQPAMIGTTCYLTDGGALQQIVLGPGTGGGSVSCYGLAYSPSGSYYVVGSFTGNAGYADGTKVASTTSTQPDMFVAQVKASDGTLLNHVELGSAGADEAMAVALTQGGLWVTGRFGGNLTLGSATLTWGNTAPEVFLLKLDTSLHGLAGYAFSGSAEHVARALAVDPNGDLVVAGDFAGILAIKSFSTFSVGGRDVFVAKIADDGNFTLRWAEQFGDALDDFGNAVAVGPLGDLAVAGQFGGTMTFPGGSPTPISATAGSGAFVLRLAP